MNSDRRALCVLRARYLFPVASPPIEDGFVTIEGARVVEIGHGPAPGEAVDLGNVAILPGFVNAHTHLEFSDLRGPLGPPGIGFVDWIRRVIDNRSAVAAADIDSRNEAGVAMGLRESLRWGTRVLGEIAQPGWSPEPFEQTQIRATIFLELIAPTESRIAAALAMAREHLAGAGSPGPGPFLGPGSLAKLSDDEQKHGPDPLARWRPGLSPHAPYSVHPRLLSEVVAMSAKQGFPIAMHLAESPEELELLQDGRGPFRDLLQQLGAWDAAALRPGMRPLHYLQSFAAAHRALVIHGNCLDDEEIAFLARHRERMAAVFCPRTHAFFGRAAYPLEKMLAAGATVALGTDSRASAPDLSVLAEMRLVAKAHPAVGRDVVLRLATLNGAKALGLDREMGSIEPGKAADLVAVALPDRSAADPHELLFDADLPALA